jgi:hypothetical protein
MVDRKNISTAFLVLNLYLGNCRQNCLVWLGIRTQKQRIGWTSHGNSIFWPECFFVIIIAMTTGLLLTSQLQETFNGLYKIYNVLWHIHSVTVNFVAKLTVILSRWYRRHYHWQPLVLEAPCQQQSCCQGLQDSVSINLRWYYYNLKMKYTDTIRIVLV